jgi:hypothetical protein
MLAFVMVVAYALLLMRTFTNTITPEPATSVDGGPLPSKSDSRRLSVRREPT